jgi:hypothetical protein
MGKGAYMLIVNNDNNNHSINIHNRHCMYDDGEYNSNISLWDNQTLSSLQATPSQGMQYIEAKASGSCTFDTSKFDVTIDDTTTIRISEKNNAYSYSIDNSDIGVTVCVNNLGNGSQAFITIAINRSEGYGDWMHHFNDETNGVFLQKTLSQVCLPGAHDAGMSVLTKSTSLSNKCNTQTQEHSIGGQLSRGVRYFDLRPAIWKSSEPTIYMGHFSNWPALGEEGSIGHSLSSVLNDVANFMANDTNGEEIVVLKFSHFISQDSTGFTESLLTSLISQMKNTIGDYMYTNSNSSVNLGNVKLQDIIDSGKRVICLFTATDTPDDGNTFTPSQLNAQISPATGIFSFGDNNSSANYRLYDVYANDHDYDDMVSDQIDKWKSFNRNNGSMFLFSYTLTSTSGGTTEGGIPSAIPGAAIYDALSASNAEGETIRDCVLDMAESANPVLMANLAYYKQVEDINTIPNILYIDKVSSQHPVKTAIYINKLFL